jgi:FkbM family methyltransferase
MHNVLRRLWNASPRSATAAFTRLLGIGQQPSGPGPRWERVTAGPLAGRELLLARDGNGVWVDMIEGRFDAELYDALAGLALRGNNIWDVGAHVGYHALGFAAQRPAAMVLCFEPNPANLARLHVNLGRNTDLASRIDVLPIAVGDRAGDLTLVVSDDVDSGASSCSFLSGSHTPLADAACAAFTRTTVPVRAIDDIAADAERLPPALIKVDVEGAEMMVLRGARRLLASAPPMWLIEVHTIGLMFEVQELLSAADYRLRLVAEHTGSRCLVLAVPNS